MDRQYIFFNTGLGFWTLALLTSFSSFIWAGGFGLLAAGSFLLYASQWKVATMFRKSGKTKDKQTDQHVTAPVATVEKERLQSEEKTSNTVIAREVRFTGNINAVGQVYVYGEVQGNIIARDGRVKIMRNGLVQGDISWQELLIDGNIQGECKAESIEIGEHAHIHGALNYATLSVKKGGVFVGNAETTRPPEHTANVIGLTPTTTVADKSLCGKTEKSKTGNA